jgi:hypothetical protein
VLSGAVDRVTIRWGHYPTRVGDGTEAEPETSELCPPLLRMSGRNGAQFVYAWQGHDVPLPDVVAGKWSNEMALPKPEHREATAESVDPEERRRDQRERNQAAIALLDQLMNVDDREAEEQQETLEYLRRVLNEDRISDRDRFTTR